jgi:hypothetical protein
MVGHGTYDAGSEFNFAYFPPTHYIPAPYLGMANMSSSGAQRRESKVQPIRIAYCLRLRQMGGAACGCTYIFTILYHTWSGAIVLENILDANAIPLLPSPPPTNLA